MRARSVHRVVVLAACLVAGSVVLAPRRAEAACVGPECGIDPEADTSMRYGCRISLRNELDQCHAAAYLDVWIRGAKQNGTYSDHREMFVWADPITCEAEYYVSFDTLRTLHGFSRVEHVTCDYYVTRYGCYATVGDADGDGEEEEQNVPTVGYRSVQVVPGSVSDPWDGSFPTEVFTPSFSCTQDNFDLLMGVPQPVRHVYRAEAKDQGGLGPLPTPYSSNPGVDCSSCDWDGGRAAWDRLPNPDIGGNGNCPGACIDHPCQDRYLGCFYAGQDWVTNWPKAPTSIIRTVDLKRDSTPGSPRGLATLFPSKDLLRPMSDYTSGPYDNVVVLVNGYDSADTASAQANRHRAYRRFKDLLKLFYEKGVDVWLLTPTLVGRDLHEQAEEAAAVVQIAAKWSSGPTDGRVQLVGVSAGGLVGRIALARWQHEAPFRSRVQTILEQSEMVQNGELEPLTETTYFQPSLTTLEAHPPVSLLATFDTPHGGANLNRELQLEAAQAGLASLQVGCALRQLLWQTCVGTCSSSRHRSFMSFGGQVEGCSALWTPPLKSLGLDGDGWPTKNQDADEDDELRIIALANGDDDGSPNTCYGDERDLAKGYSVCPQPVGGPNPYPYQPAAGAQWAAVDVKVRLNNGSDPGTAHNVLDAHLDAVDLLPGSRKEVSVDKLAASAKDLGASAAEGAAFRVKGEKYAAYATLASSASLALMGFTFTFTVLELVTAYVALFVDIEEIEIQPHQWASFTFIPLASAVDDRSCDLTSGDLAPCNKTLAQLTPHPKIDAVYANVFNGLHEGAYEKETCGFTAGGDDQCLAPGQPTTHFEKFFGEIIARGQLCTQDNGVPETQCNGWDDDHDCQVDEGVPPTGGECQYEHPDPGEDFDHDGLGDNQEIFEYCFTTSSGTCVGASGMDIRENCPQPATQHWYKDKDGDGYGCSEGHCLKLKACDPNGTWLVADRIMDCRPDVPHCAPGESPPGCCGWVQVNTDCNDDYAFITDGWPAWQDQDHDGNGGSMYLGKQCFADPGVSFSTGDCCDHVIVGSTTCNSVARTLAITGFPNSESWRESNCGDGLDNDCDGPKDGRDKGCAAQPNIYEECNPSPCPGD